MNQNPPIDSKPVDDVVGYGKYGVQVSYANGVACLTARHVGRKFLPLWLFGRTVLTRTVRLAAEGQFASTLRNGGAGLVWETVQTSAHVAPALTILGPEWPIDVRERTREQLDAALHASGGKWGGAAPAVAGVLLLGLLLGQGAPVVTATASPEVAVPGLTATDNAGMSSAQLASREAEEKGTGMPMLEAIAGSEKIQLRAAGPGQRQIILWSDPLCPNCRDFEQKVLGKLPAGVGVTVIPVAFKQGSRPLVSFVTCGVNDAERAARWSDLMSAEPVGDFSQQCASGPAAADQNSVLFARAGLEATPTIMTQDGQVFTGDRTSIADVAKWIAN